MEEVEAEVGEVNVEVEEGGRQEQQQTPVMESTLECSLG